MADRVVGRHFWAVINGELLIVLGDSSGDFTGCGPWEGTIPRRQVQLLEEVPRPAGYEQAALYYRERD